jgi:hypothetical protein
MNRYLTPAEIWDQLDTITYKPDWRFTMHKHPVDGWCIEIQFTVPDAYGAGDQDQRVLVPVPPIVDNEHFHDFMRWRLERIEHHEIAEFYRINGRQRHDPHNEPVKVL